MVGLIKCYKCNENIDKSACGQTYSIFTVNEDKNNKTTKKTKYLCGVCTSLVNLWLSGYLKFEGN